MLQDLERPCNLFHIKAFDDIADLNVLVVFKCHTAFLATIHFFDFIFKALQRRKLTFVNNNVIPDEAHLRPALHFAFCHAATKAAREQYRAFSLPESRTRSLGYRSVDTAMGA